MTNDRQMRHRRPVPNLVSSSGPGPQPEGRAGRFDEASGVKASNLRALWLAFRALRLRTSPDHWYPPTERRDREVSDSLRSKWNAIRRKVELRCAPVGRPNANRLPPFRKPTRHRPTVFPSAPSRPLRGQTPAGWPRATLWGSRGPAPSELGSRTRDALRSALRPTRPVAGASLLVGRSRGGSPPGEALFRSREVPAPTRSLKPYRRRNARLPEPTPGSSLQAVAAPRSRASNRVPLFAPGVFCLSSSLKV